MGNKKRGPFDVKWLDRNLDRVGISQNELARRIGLPPSRMSETINGKRRMTMGEAQAIARIFGCSLYDVYDAQGFESLPPPVGTITGIVSDDDQVWRIDAVKMTEHSVREVLLPIPYDGYLLQVTTGEWQPRYRVGEIIGYHRGATCDVGELAGRECIVEMPDGSRWLKVVWPGSKPKTWTLQSMSRSEPVVDVSTASICPVDFHLPAPANPKR